MKEDAPVTSTVNAARQGSGGRQERSPYGLVMLAWVDNLPCQVRSSAGESGHQPSTDEAERRVLHFACSRRRSHPHFASATQRPRLTTGMQWSAYRGFGRASPGVDGDREGQSVAPR